MNKNQFCNADTSTHPNPQTPFLHCVPQTTAPPCAGGVGGGLLLKTSAPSGFMNSVGFMCLGEAKPQPSKNINTIFIHG